MSLRHPAYLLLLQNVPCNMESMKAAIRANQVIRDGAIIRGEPKLQARIKEVRRRMVQIVRSLKTGVHILPVMVKAPQRHSQEEKADQLQLMKDQQFQVARHQVQAHKVVYQLRLVTNCWTRVRKAGSNILMRY